MSISFSVKFEIKPFKIINAQSNIFLTGSCFTENIGYYLLSSGYSPLINPFGIIYNPVSLANSLNYVIEKKQYCEADLFLTHENRYISFDHHGRFSGIDKKIVVKCINDEIDKANDFLKNADCLVITLGSAWAYYHKTFNKIVANCHKVPSKEFSKSLLSIETICKCLSLMIDNIRNFNNNISIIFTISPVKHLADGIVENQQSKATLILSLKKIVETHSEFCYYFPAYEIVTDELRDYRFYENDHAHPTLQATEYVWEKFVETCFCDDAIEKIKESSSIGKFINHRQISNSQIPNSDIFERIKLFLKKYSKD